MGARAARRKLDQNDVIEHAGLPSPPRKRRARISVEPEDVEELPIPSGSECDGSAEADHESHGTAFSNVVCDAGKSSPSSNGRVDMAGTYPIKRTAAYSTDPAALRHALALRPSTTVAVDLETRGLHPHETAEAAIGAVIVEAAGVKYIFRKLPDYWPELLADESIPKVMHNAKFDLMWMIDKCPDTENGQSIVRNVQDTMLKSQLASDYRTKSGAQKAGRSDLWRGNDLKTVLADRLGVEIGKTIDHDVTDWTGPWSDEMIEYMLEDISYLDPLNEELDRLIKAEGQERASWIENDAVFATAWMALNGIRPNLAEWGCSLSDPPWHRPATWQHPLKAEHDGPCTGAIADWIQQHELAWAELTQLWPGVENFNSPKQLVQTSSAVLGAPLQDTKKATLKQLAGTFPSVAKLLEQRHHATRLKNWGPHYLDDGVCRYPGCMRFHPGWNQIGTETSRPSCWKPNILQIPRAMEFRRLFIPDEGNLIVSLDYSAIEVLVAGVFADDKKLIAACASGDPHLATAQMVAGDSTIVKADPRRQHAKIANFGLLFGGGRDGLIRQARDLFDVYLTDREAEDIIRTYFHLYPGLKRTKNMAYEAMKSPDPRVTVVNQVGFRRYLEGFNRKPTSWLNTWIQSTAAYGMKSSFRYIREANLTPFVLGQVYDEILFEFPEECAEELAPLAKSCMVRGMKDVLGQNIPVIVDVNIGRWWV